MADIRSRNSPIPRRLTSGITLHCFACGVEKMLDPITVREILATLVNACDFKIIECACGQTQFILKARDVVIKTE